jgi:Xaa-Pro aminopeptidase
MFSKINLINLQSKLKEDGIKAYIILTSDPHDNEYIANYYMAERLFFCPFTGDAGQLVVTQDNAYLFTDGRFFIQAAKQLKDSGVTLMKIGEKGVPTIQDFIKQNNLYPLGINTMIANETFYASLNCIGAKIVDADYSYMITNRPKFSEAKVFKLDEKLTTLSYKEKIHNIIDATNKAGAKANLVTTLDDIAWILNIRGDDIDCTPVFYSYLYISKELGTHLFIKLSKIDFVIDGIEIHPYDEITKFLMKHADISTLVDKNRVNAKLFNILHKPVLGKNPAFLMKCVKGPVEIKNIKEIQILDGVAMVKFGYFLKNNLSKRLNEYEYSAQLEKYRRECPRLFELSFQTIAAVGSNAAEMHYGPTKDVHSTVTDSDQELLVDSGGQYYGGTTDTTRTYAIGKKITPEYIHDYTLTLKSVIALTNTIFIEHASGITIDIRAREIMWKEGLDYKCGTGHGVGYISNVHEGPNGFRYRHVPERDDGAEMAPGMITTIEPGVYKENKYGIRIENNLLCIPAFETSMGVFYKFDTITCVPIDTRALDLSIMNKEEIDWLNNYHSWVYKELSPFFKDNLDLLNYLKEVTKAI